MKKLCVAGVCVLAAMSVPAAAQTAALFDFGNMSIASGGYVSLGNSISIGGFTLSAVHKGSLMACSGDCFGIAGDGYAGIQSGGLSFLQFANDGLTLAVSVPGKRVFLRDLKLVGDLGAPNNITFSDERGFGVMVQEDYDNSLVSDFIPFGINTTSGTGYFSRPLNITLNPTKVQDVKAGFVSIFVSASVPEPASWAMLVSGFGLVGGAMRRRKKMTRLTA